jgi:translation elongation factor EF-Tu-like GTPase
MGQPDFVARLTFTATEQGGRRSPAKCGYHPQVKFGFSEMQTSTALAFRDKKTVPPGDSVIADMFMVGKEYFAGTLKIGMRFEVLEGKIVAAVGEVLEIVNKALEAD